MNIFFRILKISVLILLFTIIPTNLISQSGKSFIDSLPTKLSLLLSKNIDLINGINKSSLNHRLLMVSYGDSTFEGIINIVLTDSVVLVNEYEMRIFLGITYNQMFIIDTNKVKKELELRANSEVKKLKFTTKNSGVYFDSFFDKSTDFSVSLFLCKIGNNFHIEEDKNHFVDINLFHTNSNYKTFVGIVSENFIGDSRGLVDVLIERYRVLLFNLIDNRLVSNSILSPISLLIE